VFVVEETSGVILEVFGGSTQVVKSGFPRGSLTGGLAATTAGPNATKLYWIASDGLSSRLFSGSASDAAFTVVLDLSSLSPPSLAPTSLAVSERSGVAVWLDTEQNSVYTVDLGSLNSTRLTVPSTSEVQSVALDTTGRSLFLAASVGNVTQIVRRDIAFMEDPEVVYDKLASPCCGFVAALAVDSRGVAGTCASGTYTSLCVPCPGGTFVTTSLNRSCFSCHDSEYCAFGAAVPIPAAYAQNSSFAQVALLEEATFGDSSIPLIFLVVYIGVVVVVVAVFVITTICLRRYRYETMWPRYKRTCQSVDVCFRGRHYNETPGIMLHRKSVIGAFQTLLFPAILIMLAVYIGELFF
jgi:hypothetical protein